MVASASGQWEKNEEQPKARTDGEPSLGHSRTIIRRIDFELQAPRADMVSRQLRVRMMHATSGISFAGGGLHRRRNQAMSDHLEPARNK